jgi:hypothetical protein
MAALTVVSKKKPIEPEWHKKLLPIAKLAGKSGTSRGDPMVIAFSNMCRRLKDSRVLVSWELETSQDKTQVFWVKWIARDPQWSGRV